MMVDAGDPHLAQLTIIEKTVGVAKTAFKDRGSL